MKIWSEAHGLVLEIYKITKNFPKDEVYGLTSQIRRAAISIPNNIAEGTGRNGNKELSRFIFISIGSSNEVEYLIKLSFDLSYINKSEYEALTEKIIILRKRIISFQSKLNP